MTKALGAVWLGIALISCGGNSNTPTVTSFTATPATVPALGGGTTLSWIVSEASEVQIDNGIGALSSSSGSVGIDVTVSTAFTLTATNGTQTRVATATITVIQPSGNDVSGKVIDAHSNPVSGFTVLVTDSTGVKSSSTTDDDGNFSIADVARPYTATVIHESSVFIFPNITRSSPRLSLYPQAFASDNRSASIPVLITDGGVYPQPSMNYISVFSFASPEVQQTIPFSGPNDGLGVLSPDWVDSTATISNGAVYALQFAVDDAGFPSAYLGYGSVPFQLRDKAMTRATLQLSAVPLGQLNGAVAQPSSFVVDGISVYLGVTPNFNILLFGQNAGSSIFSYNVPAISGTTLSLEAIVSRPTGDCITTLTGLTPSNSTSLTVDCPAGPVTISPLNGDTGITTDTIFSWSLFTNGIYQLQFKPYADATGPTLYLWSEGTSAKLPDLSTLGLELPANTLYEWQVIAFAPLASVDALTAYPPSVGTQSTTYEAFGPPSIFYTAPAP